MFEDSDDPDYGQRWYSISHWEIFSDREVIGCFRDIAVETWANYFNFCRVVRGYVMTINSNNSRCIRTSR